ncbi:RidA family protein [Rhodococcus wratislaviensis]|uniref:RidA family protein n=1 Tax=Rhodococcus wratislaviensis TaxID=44752 RepID=UPI003512A074
MTDWKLRLEEAGYALSNPPTPNGRYRPFVRVGDQLFIAGQTCMRDGVLIHRGTVGVDVDMDEARRAAALCALNTLAVLEVATDGNLDAVRAVKMTGFIRCVSDFSAQPAVLDGASEVLETALGDRGGHARAAIGASALPRSAPVEIETVFAVDGQFQ